MPGRTETNEADGEWSDASEDAVKSGSATEGDETLIGRHLGFGGGGGGKSSLMFSSSTTLGRKDPVHCVLDKIDAELAAMSSVSSQGLKGSLRTSTTCKPKSSLPPLLPKYHSLFSGSGDNALPGNGAGSEKQTITGSAEIYTDATLTDDESRPKQTTEDFLGDFDTVVMAQQIDSRFTELMMKKKGSTTPPPPPPSFTSSSFPSQPPRPSTAPPHPPILLTLSPPTTFAAYLSTTGRTGGDDDDDNSNNNISNNPFNTNTTTNNTLTHGGTAAHASSPQGWTSRPLFSNTTTTGYGTDNDSIKTEDFESRFQNLIVMTDGGNTSCGDGSSAAARKARHKRESGTQNSGTGNGNGRGSGSGSGGGGRGVGKDGSGSGLAWAAGGSPARSSLLSSWSLPSSLSKGGGGDRGGGGGKVSFDVSAMDKSDGKLSSPSGVKLSGLNRVLQHSMKSLGETTMKEPVESGSSTLASLPPSGRSRSVSPERLMMSDSRPRTTPTDSGVSSTTTTTTKKTPAAVGPRGDRADSASEEIERQSARIQREMEKERRCRSVSPTRGLMMTSSSMTSSPSSAARSGGGGRAPTPALLQTSEFQTNTMTAASLGAHVEHADKMILGQELKTLRGALFTTKLQLREAENEARTVRQRAEEARSDLMLIDFKRTTASKDLQRLSEDVERKRAAMHGYDSEMACKRNDLRDMETLGISKDQAKKGLQEENAGLRQRLRGLQTLEMERDELCRQLSSAKEDVLREQKQSRLHREEMTEEMETLTARLEEAQNAWSEAQEQLTKLETAFRAMEREKNALIQEQSKEFSLLRSQSVAESQEKRHQLSEELDGINSELHQHRRQVATLQADCKVKDDQNRQLREEVSALTNEISQEQAARQTITEEHRKTLQMLRRETDSAMLQLRESLFLDKQRSMEELRAEIEQERRNSAFRSDERMAQMLAENADLLAEKDQSLVLLQERVRDLQEMQHATETRMQENVELQIREAVVRERMTMDTESQRQLRKERESAARDSNQRINEMQMTLDRERESTQRLIRELELMKKELEEQRKQSREAVKEKAVAVAKAKDEVRVQSKTELDSVREQLKQDMQREIDRLNSQLRKSDEECRALRADKQTSEIRERDNGTALERAEKTVITEINEECRRSAALLGVTARQVQLSNVTDSTSSRALITAALANLRAVNEEVRNQLQEVITELETCQATIPSLQRDKADSVERVRMEMETQKTLELERVKEKLMKEHTEELARVAQASARQSLSNAMVGALRRKDSEIKQLKQALAASREQEAQHYSRLYQQQMAQELEKSQALLQQSGQEQKLINQHQHREIQRLEKEVHRLALLQSSKDGISPSPQQQQQQYLQARIQQLNADNSELRRKHLQSKHNVSVPDLASVSNSRPMSPRRSVSPGPGGKLRSLEERLRRGEKEALMAEERARLKQSMLTQKMTDMATLQNTLSDQNQELLRLEHAFTQLNRQYDDTSTVPVSILNNMR